MHAHDRALARLRWLALLVVPLVWIGPALFPGRVFLPQLPALYEPLASEDPAAAALAARDANWHASDRIFPLLTTERAVAERVRAGRCPRWDPSSGTGAPLAATSIAGTWYPPRWLGWILGPERASGWLALFRLVAAGAGLVLLLARLGYGPLAQLAGALALQVSGFAFANLHYGSKLDAALWLPWSLWAIEGLRRGVRASGPWLMVATALSFLAGFVPIAIFQTAAALVRAWFARRVESMPARAPLPVVASGWIALGVLAAGVELAPALEASLDSTRGPQPAAALRAQALPPAALASSVQPHAIGEPTEPRFAPAHPLAWWLTADASTAASANPLEWQTYVGLIVLGLALAAVVARPRSACVPALGVALSHAFAFGLFPVTLAYELPPFALGAPSRALAVAWIGWPWLAAIGLDALRQRRARWSAGLVALLALALGFAWTAWCEPASFATAVEDALTARHGVPLSEVHATLPRTLLEDEARRLAPLGSELAGVAIVFVLGLALAIRWPRIAALVLVLTLALEGLHHGRAHVAPRRVAPERVFPPSTGMRALAGAAGDGRVVRLDTSASGVADVERLARPNLPSAYGIADLTPYTALPNRRTTELLAAIDPASRYRTGASRLSTPDVLGHPALDLLRVTAVLAREPVRHPRLELVLERDDFCVHRRHGALDVARLVPTGLPTHDERAALELWSQGSIDPRQATVLPPGALARSAPQPFDPGSIVVDRPDPNRLDAHVSSRSGGWLVFHEAWDAGWKATVDGADVELVRADWNARAVFVEPGEHVVRTFYEPWSLRLGTLATILALATLCACTSKSSRAGAAATRA